MTEIKFWLAFIALGSLYIGLVCGYKIGRTAESCCHYSLTYSNRIK